MMRSREQDIRRITVIGALINIILTIFKIIAGILGQSAAMVADGIHSLSYSGTWKHCNHCRCSKNGLSKPGRTP